MTTLISSTPTSLWEAEITVTMTLWDVCSEGCSQLREEVLLQREPQSKSRTIAPSPCQGNQDTVVSSQEVLSGPWGVSSLMRHSLFCYWSFVMEHPSLCLQFIGFRNELIFTILGFPAVIFRTHSFLWHAHSGWDIKTWEEKGNAKQNKQSNKLLWPLPATATNTAYISNYLSSTFSYCECLNPRPQASKANALSLCGTPNPKVIGGGGMSYILLL